jgi:[ribosomal protein S5]-alanine N-acetyltransferase
MVTQLEGTQVFLAPFAERHLMDPAYRGWLADREVVQYLGRPEYFSAVPFDDIRAYVERLWANDRCSFFAVHVKAGGAFVGTTKVTFGEKTGPVPDVADVGVMIGDRGSWGKGLATDALRATCRHAFETLGARRLTAGTMAPNVAVLRAFVRIGFVEEGRLRQQFVLDGQCADHVLLGCLRGELKADDGR